MQLSPEELAFLQAYVALCRQHNCVMVADEGMASVDVATRGRVTEGRWTRILDYYDGVVTNAAP